MTKTELQAYKQKMSPDELQQYLHFRKRGGVSKSKKGKGSYNRRDFKKGNV